MNVDAYILIGGESKRFGSNKATFVLDGMTLAERAAAVVESALRGSRISYVAASDGQFVDLRARRTVLDIKSGFGAIGAVYTALFDASEEWTFILACDLPFVSTKLIKHLSSFAADFDAVVPVQRDGRWQPLCAFYRRDTFTKSLQRALSNGRRMPSLRTIIERVNARTVGFEEYSHLADAESLLMNVNTPEDLRRS